MGEVTKSEAVYVNDGTNLTVYVYDVDVEGIILLLKTLTKILTIFYITCLYAK